MSLPKVKIVLKTSPMDPENGVWIDGEKMPGVLDVKVHGSVDRVPEVTLRLFAERVDIEAEADVTTQNRSIRDIRDDYTARILPDIEACGYECEAGPLKNNEAWNALKAAYGLAEEGEGR